jgi:G:T-mismatch repair DNA endonuclease (very short patch repair protein)
MPKLTSEIFITKSISLWGNDRWDYSKVIYIDYGTKVLLICKKHNLECEQTPHQHLRNRSDDLISPCIKCENEFIQNLNSEKIKRFIKKFKELNNKEILNKKFIEVINILLQDKLQRAPNGFWDNKEAVDCYIDWFKHKYDIKNDEDWYQIQAEDMVKNQASGLLSKYNYSIIEFLKVYYSDKEFLPWKFYRVGNNYWKDISNRKYCLTWLLKNLNYNNYEEYYNLSINMFTDNGCARLVGCYQDSTYELLKDLCSEYKWKAYKFGQVPILHWKNPINRREWCDDYYNEHQFISMDDWYKINQELIKEWYGNGLIQRYKSSPYDMLKDIYPDYSWDKSKFKVCGYSKKCCEFIEKLSESSEVPIRYARSINGEYRIPNTRYNADGYMERYNNFTNIIIEFHGCDVHGCIIEDCKFRRNKSKETNRYGCEFKIAYNKTQKKINKLKELGYIVIELWECEYKNITDYKKWFEDKLSN